MKRFPRRLTPGAPFFCLCAENKNHKKEKLKAFANGICAALCFSFFIRAIKNCPRDFGAGCLPLLAQRAAMLTLRRFARSNPAGGAIFVPASRIQNHKKEKLKAFANKICNALGFLFLSGQLKIARVILGRVAFRFSPKGLRCSRSVASPGRIPPDAPFCRLRHNYM